MSKVSDFNDLHKQGEIPADILQLSTSETFEVEAQAPPASNDDDGSGDEGRGSGSRSGKKRSPSQVEQLLELAKDIELFHDPDGDAYADVFIGDRRETLRVEGKGQTGLAARLRLAYYRTFGSAPSSEALASATATLAAAALADGPTRELFLRVAREGDSIWIDLGDETWRAVEVTAEGWQVVESPPVRFRRCPAMRPLPTPERGGKLETLRALVNVADDSAWRLLVAWLLASLGGKGPFPILVLLGEQGTGKTTLTRMVRELVDPSKGGERSIPRDDRELAVAAHNNFVVTFGNLSNVTDSQADGLCRLATGGGFATRQLYADKDETVFEAQRPIVMNGIAEVVTRADLADRAILLHLEPVTHRPEGELWAAFRDSRPGIFGALLSAIAEGLRNGRTALADGPLPRMADFVRWVQACEPALWPVGTFLADYETNRTGIVAATLDGDPVAEGLRILAVRPEGWSGTATDLLVELASFYPDATAQLPRSPRALADKVRRFAAFLRAEGVNVSMAREGKSRDRIITVSERPPAGR